MDTSPWIAVEAHTDLSWPALFEDQQAGWRLRWSGAGHNDRPNSAFPVTRSVSEELLDDANGPIAAVEHFYADRDQPASFQLVEHRSFDGLARVLSGRGYRTGGPSTAYCAASVTVVAATAPVVGASVSTEATLTDAWLAHWAEFSDASPATIAQLGGSVRSIRIPQTFVELRLDGEIAAVGRACAGDGLVGMFNLATAPPLRGRRLVSAVLHELVRWGLHHGAQTTYLQVDRDNAGARRAYDRAGYQIRYDYYYLKSAR